MLVALSQNYAFKVVNKLAFFRLVRSMQGWDGTEEALHNYGYSWISSVEGDDGSCWSKWLADMFMTTHTHPKYAAQTWQHCKHVWLLGRSGCSSPSSMYKSTLVKIQMLIIYENICFWTKQQFHVHLFGKLLTKTFCNFCFQRFEILVCNSHGREFHRGTIFCPEVWQNIKY